MARTLADIPLGCPIPAGLMVEHPPSVADRARHMRDDPDHPFRWRGVRCDVDTARWIMRFTVEGRHRARAGR